jgi:hypothetical protein
MTLLACETQKNKTDFKAERISRTASFVVNAEIEKTFPLFGPVREMAWAEGWNPHLVYSETKDVEARMIFETPGRFEGEEKYTWIITQYFPQEYLIEYAVSTPERIWFITVQCEGFGNKTKTTVTYTFTGLTERGNKRNNEALSKMYADNLKDWEEAINSYLKQENN